MMPKVYTKTLHGSNIIPSGQPDSKAGRSISWLSPRNYPLLPPRAGAAGLTTGTHHGVTIRWGGQFEQRHSSALLLIIAVLSFHPLLCLGLTMLEKPLISRYNLFPSRC
jgi:hypothetical protein